MHIRCSLPSTSRIGGGRLLALALVTVLGGLAPAFADPAVSEAPTFAAHDVHGGLVVDRMEGHEPAVATAPSWLRMPGQPTLVVKDGDKEEAALWLTAPAEVVVRKAASTSAPLDGQVKPSWENESIRLTIEPANAPPLKSDIFVREDLDAGPRELTRRAALSTDVQGSYRALLRRPDGKPVGWLRVRVSAHGWSPVRYEAVLPPQVDEGLAVASAEALDSEIDWIRDEAYGVHRGTRRP
jgi:hypothetical protein